MPMSLDRLESVLEAWDNATVTTAANDGWFYFSEASEQLKLSDAEIDPGKLKYVLLILEKIETPGVRGDQRVRKLVDNSEPNYAQRLIAASREVLSELSERNGAMRPDDLKPFVTDHGLADADVDNVKKLLSTIGQIQLTKRTGAVSLPPTNTNSVIPDTAMSEAVSADSGDPEGALYPYAYQVIYDKLNLYDTFYKVRTVDFRVGVTGGHGGILRNGGGATTKSGKYLTPDVVAYQIVASESALFPVLRVYTVEVKLSLTLEGVAEAAAHRRFAHYAYVMTPESFGDIEDSLKIECAKNRIGMVAPSTRNSRSFYIQIEAQLNRPDEAEVDALLRDTRLPDEGDPAVKVQFSVEAARAIKTELLQQVFVNGK